MQHRGPELAHRAELQALESALEVGGQGRGRRAHESAYACEEWGRFLPETVTATSLLDRLLHHATVVVTSGESFRMREARSRVAPRAKADGASGPRPAKTTP